jgi:hypothetical protein
MKVPRAAAAAGRSQPQVHLRLGHLRMSSEFAANFLLAVEGLAVGAALAAARSVRCELGIFMMMARRSGRPLQT